MRRQRSSGISRRAFLVGGVGVLGASAIVSPPGRNLLGLSGWWLTNSTAPEVRLSVPEGVSRGAVQVTVEVGPTPSWAFVEASIDGRPLEPGPVIAIDTRQLKDGDHLVRLAVRDGSLRRNVRWVDAPLRSDNTPPQVVLETKSPNGIQGRTVKLEARANEPVQLSLQQGQNPPIYFAEEGGAYVALIGIDPAAAPGSAPFKLVARDLAGNETVLDTQIQVGRGSFLSEHIVLSADHLRFFTSGQYDLELKQLNEYYSNSGNEKLWEGSFEQPVRGVVSSGYGIDRSFNGAERRRHLGTDFDVPVGTPIAAVARGKVVFAQQLPVRGNAVVLDHGVGVHSTYYHMSRLDVKPGDLVAKSQPLGLSGATGMVTGPHLHFEIRIAGVAVEPMEWLRTRFL